MVVLGNVGYYDGSPTVTNAKGYTYLLHQDPASASGVINTVTVNIFAGAGIDIAKISVFRKIGVDYFRQDFANINLPIAAGEHSLSLSKPLSFQSGDFIAIYSANRDIKGVVAFTHEAIRFPGDVSIFAPTAPVGGSPVCFGGIDPSPIGRYFFQGRPVP